MRSAFLVMLLSVGCYSPSYRDCDISCSNGTCPSGLSCNTEQRCVADHATSCAGLADAPGPDAIYCGTWPFPVSTVPCPLQQQPTDWTISGLQTLSAVSPPVVPGTNPPMATVITATPAQPAYVLIVVHDFTVSQQSVLTISGNAQMQLPVVIVASGTVDLEGVIGVAPSAGPDPITASQCAGGIGGSAINCGTTGAPGGGGGGYGQPGKPGGGCPTNPGGAGGIVNGTPSLAPLRAGCPGGNGDSFTSSGATPLGGRGGGAIQISATRLIIGPNGRVAAPGAGGGRGSGPQDGGGGGGAGGSILLEAASASIAGAVCANGGGGASESANGSPGICANLPAPGGSGSAVGGNGGYGTTDPTPGTMQSSTSQFGSGGGGGVGRIHIHVSNPMTVDPGAIITPPPS